MPWHIAWETCLLCNGSFGNCVFRKQLVESLAGDVGREARRSDVTVRKGFGPVRAFCKRRCLPAAFAGTRRARRGIAAPTPEGRCTVFRKSYRPARVVARRSPSAGTA